MIDPDLKALFAEVAAEQKITEQRMQQTDRQMQQFIANGDKRQAEADKRQAEADKRQEEADKRQAEADKRQAKIDKRIDNLGKVFEETENFIRNDAQSDEEYFYRSLESTLRLGNLQFDDITRNLQVRSHDPEFDIVMFNSDSVALIETKKKAHHLDLADMPQTKAAQFRQCFPRYADYKLYFGIATMATYQNTIAAAKKAKIFLLTQKGDQLVSLNDDVREI